MKKALIIGVIILVILIGGYYWLYRINSKPMSGFSSSVPLVATSTATTSISIRVPVGIYDGLYGSRSQITTPFVNTSTSETITLRQTGGTGDNLTFEAYLNKEDVGEVDGGWIEFFGFSPDNKYFGIRTASTLGSDSSAYILDILDLANKKPIYIEAPSVTSSTPQPSGYETFPVIASSSWNSDDSLNVAAYMAVGDYNSQTNQLTYYRISPEEVWQYNLTTGSYKFLQALPEASSTAGQ